mmetsp:Transcript_16482/g.29394  ORF Transcript_16482/g.29394 Transcript_16482/m.29394 type:complete len:141 (-) Transcript_16482:745-1167(-)
MADQAVLLIDGDCVLCSGFVKFILRNGCPDSVFFETQQSDRGAQLLDTLGMPMDLSTVVLVEKTGSSTVGYTKSTAVLRLFGRFPCPLRTLYGFIVMPTFIRDTCYDLVAKNRFRLFGKTEACGLPDVATRKRLNRWLEE